MPFQRGLAACLGERRDNAGKLPNLYVATVYPLARVCDRGQVIGNLQVQSAL
jgi:hypothetical protein